MSEQVTCPKCGRPGRREVARFRSRGRVYEYVCMRHYEGGRVKRCILSRLDGAPVEARGRRASRAPVERAPKVDGRALWYIVKAAASWGSLRENPTVENLSRFKETLSEVAERRGVDVGAAAAAAERYVSARSDRARAAVNEALVAMAVELLSKEGAAAERRVEAPAPTLAPQPPRPSLARRILAALRLSK